MHNPLEQSDPKSLSTMLDLDLQLGQDWTEPELGAMLRHLMQAELEPDLTRSAPGGEKRFSALRAANPRLPQTFGQALQNSDTPPELLELIKDFAKACGASTAHSPLPEQVATVLYYAAILAARLNCEKSISGLDDATLLQGVQWSLQRAWVADPIALLMQQAQSKLSR